MPYPPPTSPPPAGCATLAGVVCTIVLLRRVHARYPLVVAANRDESFFRAWDPPTVLAESPRVVGGVDRERGGTWMGATREGFFVGITNQRTYTGPVPGLRSRGELTMETLRRGSVEHALDWLVTVDPREFNAFNLVLADAERAVVVYGRIENTRVSIDEVPEGVHVLPNDRLDAPDFPKVARAKLLIEASGIDLGEGRDFDAAAETLRSVLADGTKAPLSELPRPPSAQFNEDALRELSAICVRTPFYGTISSTLCALDEQGVAHYRFAPGPPDRTPFEDVTPLFGRAST